MSFLHCHECEWSQDDFYEKDGYNPLRQNWMDHYADSLLEDTVDITEMVREYFEWVRNRNKDTMENIWNHFSINICEKDGDRWIMYGRDYVVWHLRNLADRFETQRWLTKEDWLNSNNRSCPNCDSKLCED